MMYLQVLLSVYNGFRRMDYDSVILGRVPTSSLCRVPGPHPRPLSQRLGEGRLPSLPCQAPLTQWLGEGPGVRAGLAAAHPTHDQPHKTQRRATAAGAGFLAPAASPSRAG